MFAPEVANALNVLTYRHGSIYSAIIQGGSRGARRVVIAERGLA